MASSRPSSGPNSRPTSRWLTRRGPVLALSDAARQVLNTHLPELPLPRRPVYVRFGFTAAATAFALPRFITLHRGRYERLDDRHQLGLLAHELVHVAQYAALAPGGIARFLVRYAPDYYRDPDNYRMPAALRATSLSGLSLLEAGYTLDQIAERFRHALMLRWPVQEANRPLADNAATGYKSGEELSR